MSRNILPKLTMEKEWVNVQKNTFKNWLNSQLEEEGVLVQDITKDLRDGLVLIKLIFHLDPKAEIGRYHKNPRMEPLMLENISLCVDYFKNSGAKYIDTQVVNK